MSIEWMDDFTIYGTDAGRTGRLFDGPYAEASWIDLIVDPDPTAGGGRVMQVQSNTNAILRKVLTGARTTVGVAARYWLTAIPADANVAPYIARFSDINSNTHCFVNVNPSGYLVAYRHDTGVDTQIGISAGPVVIANAWRHMETKCILDAVNGRIQVKIEGVLALDTGIVRTSSNVVGAVATISNVSFINARLLGAGPSINIKDLIIWNGLGTANNDFMGSCQVLKIIPNGDIALNWTPNPADGIGYDKINEVTPDEDTRYIMAPTPAPAAYKCSLTDLPVSVTSVRGVMPIYRGRKSDGGDGAAQVGVISGVNTGLGVDRQISSAYTYWWDIFDLDPSGGAWTRTLVNAANLQFNRTV